VRTGGGAATLGRLAAGVPLDAAIAHVLAAL